MGLNWLIWSVGRGLAPAARLHKLIDMVVGAGLCARPKYFHNPAGGGGTPPLQRLCGKHYSAESREILRSLHFPQYDISIYLFVTLSV